MGIWTWLTRPKQRPDLRVVLHTRTGCHLCEDALVELRRLERRHGFALRVQDIDAEPELAVKFGTCVPVIEVNGKVRQRGRFSEILFRRLIDAPAK
jgi:glutaredoxin